MSEMTYRQAGDYQIPNLQLENEGEKPLGKYGRMRRAFLEQNNPMLLNDMILTESLFPHLWEIEETAKARVEFLMEQYLKDRPAPDKETQQMAWVQHMNSLKAQAEEKGYTYVDWNVCAEDAVGGKPSANTIYRNVVRETGEQTQCIVLMHDSATTRTTAEALPDIIQWYKDQGFAFCTVEQVLKP